MNGIIYKSIGGFYYVKTADGSIIECKPRGIFRKKKIKPVAGDAVVLVEEEGTYTIDEVLPRKNVFIRPPVANVDQFAIVISMVDPSPSFLVVDKLTAIAFQNKATPILLLTKTDLADAEIFCEAYQNSGIDVLQINAQTDEGISELRDKLNGKFTVLCGNSGVGKSTLLNCLLPTLKRETGEISTKLGRGKHTTREVEVFDFDEAGQIADTPGFASLNLQQVSPIAKQDMQWVFPEIAKRTNECKFVDCSHILETGCAVRHAVENGEISAPRYESYVTLYKEAKENEKY